MVLESHGLLKRGLWFFFWQGIQEICRGRICYYDREGMFPDMERSSGGFVFFLKKKLV